MKQGTLRTQSPHWAIDLVKEFHRYVVCCPWLHSRQRNNVCDDCRVMRKTWTLLQHRRKKDLHSTRMSKCRMLAFSFDDRVARLTYLQAVCSAEVSAAYATVTQQSPLFAVHVNSATFSLSLRPSLTLWEIFVQS